MTDTTSSDYPCNCRSCGTIISPSVTDMCEECEIAVERNYKKFYTPMTDPTDKRIEELWQYIPPYTAPNHPPQVEVITTTNTGDTPMTEEDPDLLAGDNLDRLRGRNLTEELENARYQNNLLVQKCRELEKERDEARREVCGFHHLTGFLSGDYARSRNWDCYENYSGEGFPQSVKDFKEFLNAHSEEDSKTIERLREENRQLRELKMRGVVSEPVKATPPKYDLGDDQ